MKPLPLIKLYNTNGIGVIVIHETGVLYSNQVGGYACLHPEIEGVYIPLHNELVPQEDELMTFFTGSKWQGWCDTEIDNETADFVDTVLSKSPDTKQFKVNRSMLKNSCEAWVNVKILPTGEERNLSLLRDFESGKGILTWENSD
jgi:hypothetical protein